MRPIFASRLEGDSALDLQVAGTAHWARYRIARVFGFAGRRWFIGIIRAEPRKSA